LTGGSRTEQDHSFAVLESGQMQGAGVVAHDQVCVVQSALELLKIHRLQELKILNLLPALSFRRPHNKNRVNTCPGKPVSQFQVVVQGPAFGQMSSPGEYQRPGKVFFDLATDEEVLPCLPPC
jgi:hypothetical protein